MKLLTPAKASTKIAKSDRANLGYMTAIMYLAPYNVSGNQVCSSASKGCAAACLYTAGRGRFNNVQQARINRTKLFFENRDAFFSQLVEEITSFIKKCDKNQQKPAIRLNDTSDLMWERIFPSLFSTFFNVQFYDYTKHYKRMLNWCHGNLPSNYHLTFSRNEVNEVKALDVMLFGGNVAAVFDVMPESWYGYSVFNADKHDLRFLDPKGVAGLMAKGDAKTDQSGFVVRA